MWFRNLTVFHLTDFGIREPEALHERLAGQGFRPCLGQEAVTAGWVSPVGPDYTSLVHTVGHCHLLCLQVQEKLLPASVVREALDERVAEAEGREQRRLRRRERDALRDEVMATLLPRAFTRTRRNYGYLDLDRDWLVLDTASRKTVEQFTGLLRKALGSLPVAPLSVSRPPSLVLADWLRSGQVPQGFELGDSCELRAAGDDGGVVRCRGEDLLGAEIGAHLAGGKCVTQVSFNWREQLGGVLSDDLAVRRLHLLSSALDALAEDAIDSPEAALDAEFALLSGEVARFLPELLACFGGSTAGAQTSQTAREQVTVESAPV